LFGHFPTIFDETAENVIFWQKRQVGAKAKKFENLFLGHLSSDFNETGANLFVATRIFRKNYETGNSKLKLKFCVAVFEKMAKLYPFSCFQKFKAQKIPGPPRES